MIPFSLPSPLLSPLSLSLPSRSPASFSPASPFLPFNFLTAVLYLFVEGRTNGKGVFEVVKKKKVE